MRRLFFWLCLSLAPAMAFAAQGFTLDSPTLSDGARMPIANVYTQCGGGNVSPALQWHHPPANTRGFAVTMYDPDASGGFWHWIIFEIPIGAHGLNADAGAPRSGNAPGDQRFRQPRLFRSLPAGRQAAPLRDHRVRARCA
jgi:hypothetical protein